MGSNGSLLAYVNQNLPFLHRHQTVPINIPKFFSDESLNETRLAKPPSLPSPHCKIAAAKHLSKYTMMMLINVNVVALLYLSLHLLVVPALSADVRYCDRRAEYDVKVHDVEISPYPVIKGQPATFSISATSSQPITGGKLVIDVSYFGVHIHSEVHDLCAETFCPVSTGDFLIAHSQVLPGFTPPGSYTLKMKMEDTNKHQLSCIGFDFSIGSASSVADS